MHRRCDPLFPTEAGDGLRRGLRELTPPMVGRPAEPVMTGMEPERLAMGAPGGRPRTCRSKGDRLLVRLLASLPLSQLMLSRLAAAGMPPPAAVSIDAGQRKPDGRVQAAPSMVR